MKAILHLTQILNFNWQNTKHTLKWNLKTNRYNWYLKKLLHYWFILREYTLCLIIIIKSVVRTIIHCLGLGHEAMVCAVCLPIFLCLQDNQYINTLRPRQNGRNFRRHFQMHFYQWHILYFDSNFTKFVLKGPIDNKLALVQVMAWQWSGDKPLSETMVT